MHFKQIILNIFLLCLINYCHAQIDPIDTDRPDQTESAVLVPKNWIQFEAGFNYVNHGDDEKEFLIPTLLVRYGVCRWFELRLATAVKTRSSLQIPNRTIHQTGIDITQLGAKISLFEEKNAFPKTSLIFHVGIPSFSSAKFRPAKITKDFLFTMAHTLSPSVSFAYNAGCEWDGSATGPAYFYTISMGFNTSERSYIFIEGFGSFKKRYPPEHNLDAGISYKVNNNFKLDISGGAGLTRSAPAWFIGCGASVRFELKHIK